MKDQQIPHAVNEHGDYAYWCRACAAHRRSVDDARKALVEIAPRQRLVVLGLSAEAREQLAAAAQAALDDLASEPSEPAHDALGFAPPTCASRGCGHVVDYGGDVCDACKVSARAGDDWTGRVELWGRFEVAGRALLYTDPGRLEALVRALELHPPITPPKDRKETE